MMAMSSFLEGDTRYVCNCLPSDTGKSKLAGVVLHEHIFESVAQTYCSNPFEYPRFIRCVPRWATASKMNQAGSPSSTSSCYAPRQQRPLDTSIRQKALIAALLSTLR